MRDAVIVSAVRTPIGRHGGALASVRPDDLTAIVLSHAVDRAEIRPPDVDDVIMGCTNQAGEDNRNVARMGLLLAGFPVEVPGQTVNRLCGSGLQAVASAAHAIRSGEGEVIVTGGVESMSRAPFVMLKPEAAYARGSPQVADTVLGWRFPNPRLSDDWTISLGETAEIVAADHSVSRESQDAFAMESQRRAAQAMGEGRFASEIVPVRVARRRGDPHLVDTDEHPRPGTTLEQLAKLEPVFRKAGTVTAGNSSGINDGAAAIVLMSEERARELGLTPMARVVASAVAGVEPHRMGMGPVPSTERALKRAGMSVGDVDLAEVNEAFAAQALPCIERIGLDPDRTNVNGGAIALGHPVGCSGARILTTLLHEMGRRGAATGLATMCIGVGQGIAMIVERT